MSRNNKLIFKVFCEGDTEYNYFEGFRKKNNLNLALRPINMDGGGYSNFLSEIKKDGSFNSIAKFIIIDGDRASAEKGEKDKLKELIDYCILQNDKGDTPHILIINYPDFEYLACLHSPKFNKQNINNFIKSEYNYKSVNDFKADQKVFEKLNTKSNSYFTMLKNVSSKFAFISNKIDVKKSKFLINVKTEKKLENIGKRGSNINDFFFILRGFDEKV